MSFKPISNPFDLHDDASYRVWRDAKLAAYPKYARELVVEVLDPHALSDVERSAIADRLRKTNIVIYQLRDPSLGTREAVRALGYAFGLNNLDANPYADGDRITALQARTDAAAKGFIPYSTKALNWHTDGYYNPPERRIRSFIMHCVVPAEIGGENGLMDHEVAYIHLRERNPALVEALMQDDAMTIPANTEDGQELRAAQSGPVFSIDQGHLHMRYTARMRSVQWADRPAVTGASAALSDLLRSDTPYLFRLKLQAGQGLICNNVLHSRSGYQDLGPDKRLLFRARYYERAEA